MESIMASKSTFSTLESEPDCDATASTGHRRRQTGFGITFLVLTLSTAFVAFSATSIIARHAGENVSASGIGLTAHAPLFIEPERVDLGVVAPDSMNRMTITLRNTGRHPIRVASVSSTCSCTAAEIPTGSIEPGGMAEVVVRMRAHRKAGRINERSLSFFVEGWKEPVRVVVRCESAQALDSSRGLIE